MALHLVRQAHSVTLVPRTLEEAMVLSTERENRFFLPGFQLPQDLQIGLELAPALMEAEVCILACPSKFLRSVCRELKTQLAQAERLRTVLSLCKGLEEGSLRYPHEVIAEELPEFNHAVLSGPTFASQVAEGQPSAIVLASDANEEDTIALQEALSSDTLRVYRSSDMAGVEIGGSLKNVYAIASGLCDGLGLRDNSKAGLLTRALHEMVKVGTALGGKPETFYGLTGLGDLMLTCNGKESRNRTFGEAIAKGTPIRELIEERKMTVEGYWACACYQDVCKQKAIEAPILEQIHAILYHGRDLRQAMSELMGRRLKAESA